MVYIQPFMSDAVDGMARNVAGQCLALRSRRLARRVSRLYDEALRGHGVTVAQFGLLTAIIRSGTTSPTALSRALDLEKSTLSRNLALMVEHGWISSQPDGARGVSLRALAAGRRTFERAYPAWEAAQAQAATLMTREAANPAP
jgi:DNA-binding MarR family transcriptional regulator